MPGFLEKKGVELISDVMERKGIKPGELNERIEETLEIIHQFMPVINEIQQTSESLETDVNELRAEMQEFNDNSDEMATAMNNLAESLEKFSDMMEEVEEYEK